MPTVNSGFTATWTFYKTDFCILSSKMPHWWHKSLRNLVSSSDWLTKCLEVTDKRHRVTKIKRCLIIFYPKNTYFLGLYLLYYKGCFTFAVIKFAGKLKTFTTIHKRQKPKQIYLRNHVTVRCNKKFLNIDLHCMIISMEWRCRSQNVPAMVSDKRQLY